MSGLDDVLLDLLSRLSNASLTLDPLAEARLSALEGTRVQFEIALPLLAPAADQKSAAHKAPAADQKSAAHEESVAEKVLTLRITDGQLEFTPGPHELSGPQTKDSQPHAIVRGSIPSVLAWLGGSGAVSDTLTFEGNETILAELAGILRSYEPDLADPLTSLLGGEAAENLIGAAETAFAAFRSVLESASSAAQHSAGRSFVSAPKLDTLLTGLDALQLRTDRLAAKVRAAEAGRAAARASEPVENPR